MVRGGNCHIMSETETSSDVSAIKAEDFNRMRGLAGPPEIVNCDQTPKTCTGKAIKFIESVKKLKSPNAILDTFAEALKDFGIDYFCFAKAIGNPDDFWPKTTHNRMHNEWEKHFFANNYATINPLVPMAVKQQEPIFWHEANNKSWLTVKQQKLFNDASEFGIRDGLLVPLFGHRRMAAKMIGLGSQLHTCPTARTSVHMMSIYTYNVLLRKQQDEKIAAKELTQREIDCLRWVAKGKSDWGISEILCVSGSTVHWHIEQSKKKMGVATRVQAVVEAMRRGYLD